MSLLLLLLGEDDEVPPTTRPPILIRRGYLTDSLAQARQEDDELLAWVDTNRPDPLRRA